jgi:hypothetical protein
MVPTSTISSDQTRVFGFCQGRGFFVFAGKLLVDLYLPGRSVHGNHLPVFEKLHKVRDADNTMKGATMKAAMKQ